MVVGWKDLRRRRKKEENGKYFNGQTLQPEAYCKKEFVYTVAVDGFGYNITRLNCIKIASKQLKGNMLTSEAE